MYVTGFTPIEARVRDHDFDSGDEQGKKAEGGDPMSDADERGVPRRNRPGWDGCGGSCGPSGIAHTGMPNRAYGMLPSGAPLCKQARSGDDSCEIKPDKVRCFGCKSAPQCAEALPLR